MGSDGLLDFPYKDPIHGKFSAEIINELERAN